MVRNYNYKIIMDCEAYYVKISNQWLDSNGMLTNRISNANSFKTLSKAEDGVYNYMVKHNH
ncbi:MAG: hypothetical protein MJZ34_10470 [Paludibacteraceae bacterium]|nr:hypothetical protein [Paludibacteraceae bacterium]